MDTGELSRNPDEMLGVTLQWTTILWGGGGEGSNTSSSFMAQKPG